MSRTIAALFDTRSDAEAARARLNSANIDVERIYIHDQSDDNYRSSGDYSTREDRGFWDSIKNAFLPDEDRHTYEEGVRRGGAVLTVDVDEDEVTEAVNVLESTNAVNVDERAERWRSEGWNYGTGAASMRGGTSDEQAIPVVEEQLQVGKREVDRGGVRVRSYVTEVPVHEQLRLRNEHVDVERRRVDQPLSGADADAFRERSVEVTARGEEAMVNKEARVVEEVVVRKTADEEVRNIDETVRRTDVEVENIDSDDTSRLDRDRNGY